MRIALISNPRAGNTWVRTVLSARLGLAEIAVHHPRDIPADLPERVILQLHWDRTPELRALLAREGFRVLVLARHPLDVLLSILHFVRREPETARWLDGAGGITPALVGASPTSDAFREFALGPGAGRLLGVSPQWWRDPASVTARYETLVADPRGGFEALIRRLGGGADPVPDSGQPLDLALDRGRLDVWKALPNRHGWQGTPGLWRALIPTATALRIRARHGRAFATLGYPLALNVLGSKRAARNWQAMAPD